MGRDGDVEVSKWPWFDKRTYGCRYQQRVCETANALPAPRTGRRELSRPQSNRTPTVCATTTLADEMRLRRQATVYRTNLFFVQQRCCGGEGFRRE